MDEARLARIAAANIAVALAVVAIKYMAYVLSGSVALFSDALESIVNVMTAAAAFAAIRLSAKPADSDHPFGHHKAEFLAAMFEGAMIAVAAVLILLKARTALIQGVRLEHSATGIALNILASVLNAAWAWLLIQRGKLWRSPALVADGQHLVTDVITSAGVVIGVALAMLSGWHILDPLIAAAVALNILWMGYQIAVQSMSRLLDQAASPEIEQRIREVIEANGGGALEAHDIRTRQAGRALFIEFHLVVPGSMSVDAAHVICDRLELAIEKAIDGSEVVIHVEPEHKAKPEESGAVPL
ncbi:cation diffusion facilitator family transporter [Hyphomicrobium sp.]|uniref:cation diffusion facilitator family transporter n=1 Tax=Hyphomicrobium sp. TaxID=82 RepID=UPI002B868E56|nr:cation diffusion facilitator family transporter [Hyphomicrobium sp.]HVZ03242.1 cation diffusion facilitator family transporter [Hyphomicrobium sp.]